MTKRDFQAKEYAEELQKERITQSLTADRFASAIQEADKLQARVAELEKQLNTLLESQLWGVNCKPSAPDWLTKEDRETLLRLSYSLDYVQFATSADFIRSLLARSTPKVKEASND